MSTKMNLPDAGISRGGHERAEGIATETFGREDDPEIYQKEIDERITKIRPMATPIDQISRYATAQRSGSFEVKYYSVGTRPVKTTLTTAVTASSTPSVEIEVADPDMFTLDDTIRVVGVKAKTDYKGVAYNANAANTPDLVLCVCGKTSTGQPIVYAVNGTMVSQQPIGVPAIPVLWPDEEGENKVMDLIADHKFDLIVNVPKNHTKRELTNGYRIRRGAIDHNIPLITNVRLAKAFIEAFTAMSEDDIKIRAGCRQRE